MAIRNIVKDGDPVLAKRCRPVEQFDDRLSQLIDDMMQTLKKANGVGLAAPQVGVLKRVFIIDMGDRMIEAVNPEIIKAGGKQRGVEGCLSCPNIWGYVTRPKHCTLRAYNRKGEQYELKLSDLEARCACHEYDHLEGQLFVRLVDEYVTYEDE